jgi:hypothetical protein
VGKDLGDAEWNPGLAGISTLYHVPEGENPGTQAGLEPGDYALNGHHRRDLAFRSVPETELPSQYIDAGNDPRLDVIKDKDGNSLRNVRPEEARAFGALQNMAEQRGTAFDMAKFMRDTSLGPDDVARFGISLSEAKTSDASGLAKLSPFLWKQVVTQQMKESLGVVLGRELPDDPEAQNDVYKEIAGQKFSNQEVADLIRLRRTSDVLSEQSSLFGKDFLKTSTLPQQVKILDHVRDDLGKNSRLMESAARGKGALEAAGETTIDQPELRARAGEARQLGDLLPRFAYQAGSETNN